MNKRKTVKKLHLHKETLRQLEDGELKKAAGRAEAAPIAGGSWESDCNFTCGRESCLGACTLNCSWLWPFCPTA